MLVWMGSDGVEGGGRGQGLVDNCGSSNWVVLTQVNSLMLECVIIRLQPGNYTLYHSASSLSVRQTGAGIFPI